MLRHLGRVREASWSRHLGYLHYLVPAITTTASILLLGEPLNALIVAGLVMTIGGLLLSQGSQ